MRIVNRIYSQIGLCSHLMFLIFSIFLKMPISADELLPQKVGATTIPFFDELRKRPLITEVWYPIESQVKALPVHSWGQMVDEARDTPFTCKATKKYPLIVMSHGAGGSRDDLAWLGAMLVKQGYIVASVDHYGNTWYMNQPKEALKRWERPKDITYVIDQLLIDPVFGPCINPDKIGFAGFSLGGLAGIWLAGGIANNYEKPTLAEVNKEFPDADQDLINSIDFSKAKKDIMIRKSERPF